MRQIVRAAVLATILLVGATAPAAARDGSAKADNIGIIVIGATGSMLYKIPHIDATGTPLTDTELKALFAISDPAPFADRLKKFTAAAITIPEIDAEGTFGGAAVKIVYSDVKLADVASGKIGAASIARVSFATSRQDVGEIGGNYGAIEARNLDLGAFARAVIEACTAADEPLQPLFDSITIDSLRLTASRDFDISVGKMSARDVRGRGLSVPFFDLPKAIGRIEPGAQPDERQAKVIAAFIADILTSFSIGTLEVRDLAMDVTGARPAELRVGRLAIGDFGDGKIGEISYQGIDMSSDEASVEFGTLALRGLDMRPLLQVLDRALAAGAHGLDGLDPRRFLPTLDQIVLADVAFDVPDEKHTGNAADGTRDRFQIGRLEFDAANYLDGIPTAFSSALDHLVMQLPANTANANLEQFFALGYSGIDLSVRLDLAWDEAAQEFSAEEISAALAGIGRVRVAATFGNVTKDLFASDPAVVEAAALGAVLKNVDVFIENGGIVEKGIAAEARKEQKTPDQIRQMLVSTAAVGIPAALGNGPAAKAIGSAVAKFAAQPKTLHFVASSKEGLGAADLALVNQPADLLAKIDLSAAANE
jgi:hypothetical protein